MNYIRRKFLAAGLAFIFFDRRRSLWICSGFALLSFFAEIKLSVPGLFSSSGAIFTIAGLFLNIKHTLHFHLKLPKKNIYNMLAGAGIFGSDMTKEG